MIHAASVIDANVFIFSGSFLCEPNLLFYPKSPLRSIRGHNTISFAPWSEFGFGTPAAWGHCKDGGSGYAMGKSGWVDGASCSESGE